MVPYKEVKESHIIEAIWDDHLRRENGTELSLSGKNEAKIFSNLTPWPGRTTMAGIRSFVQKLCLY